MKKFSTGSSTSILNLLFHGLYYINLCTSGHGQHLDANPVNRAGRFTAYNLSKKALMHLTRMAALDLAQGSVSTALLLDRC